jgi:2-hydroxychromene-2-carboxylate isomerase
MRWPDTWPSNYLVAMRATVYAYSVGPGRAFVMQAYRNAFQRGADLSIPTVAVGDELFWGDDRLEDAAGFRRGSR